jgi:hypothetical protein
MGRKVVGLAHPMWPKYTEAHYQLTYFLFVREKKLTYCLFFSCRVCRTVRWLILPREHGPKGCYTYGLQATEFAYGMTWWKIRGGRVLKSRSAKTR